MTEAIQRRLPEYAYLYLGDTKRVPYGGRSQSTIHQFTGEALQYLFAHDCKIVILACNTASAEALRKSQQEYLPVAHPDRRVLGVIIPTVEEVIARCGKEGRIGVLATQSTVESRAYERELVRQGYVGEVVQIAAPLLVPLVEHDGLRYAKQVIVDYLAEMGVVDAIVLGCTHYSLLKEVIREVADAPVFSQDEIIPKKLADYLRRHPEIDGDLSKNSERSYLVTDLTEGYCAIAGRIAGREVDLELIEL
jgi:glutamate racemase